VQDVHLGAGCLLAYAAEELVSQGQRRRAVVEPPDDQRPGRQTLVVDPTQRRLLHAGYAGHPDARGDPLPALLRCLALREQGNLVHPLDEIVGDLVAPVGLRVGLDPHRLSRWGPRRYALLQLGIEEHSGVAWIVRRKGTAVDNDSGRDE